jgi:hypothetical protein
MRFRLQVRQPALCVGGAALLQGEQAKSFELQP